MKYTLNDFEITKDAFDKVFDLYESEHSMHLMFHVHYVQDGNPIERWLFNDDTCGCVKILEKVED